MEDVLDQLREQNQSVAYPLERPTHEQLVEAQEEILLHIPRDMKEFMLLTGDVIYGRLEPVTAADPHSHTFLPEVAANAWAEGLPREYLPVCADGADYYVISQEGEVYLWHGDDESLDEEWASIWHWARDVWLES
ncbi:MAG: SMI1/KNR4 family protein [Pontibacterium sp.]